MEGDLGYGGYLLRLADQAVDAGDLARAEQLLDLGQTEITTAADTEAGAEMRVNALLLGSTIAQHRLQLDRAEELAEEKHTDMLVGIVRIRHLETMT